MVWQRWLQTFERIYRPWHGKHLTADWGQEVAQISDDDVLVAYFDALRRRPALRPRKIWIADDFACPQEYLAGWTQLQRKVIDGEELRPHLSRGHARLSTLDGPPQ
jgi:hypothetical protein